MSSIVSGAFALLWLMATVVGNSCGCPEPPEECDAIRKTVELFIRRVPVFAEMSPAFGCKEASLQWLLGCLDLMPYVDSEIPKAITKLATITQGGKSVVMNGSEMLKVVSKDNVDISFRCCQPLCQMGIKHCGCRKFAYDGLVELFGGDEEVVKQLVAQSTRLCMSKHSPKLNFESPLQGSIECDKPIVSSGGFTCSD